MTELTEMVDPVTGEIIDERRVAEHLRARAKEEGVGLVGPEGLLAGLTRRVIGTAVGC